MASFFFRTLRLQFVTVTYSLHFKVVIYPTYWAQPLFPESWCVSCMFQDYIILMTFSVTIPMIFHFLFSCAGNEEIIPFEAISGLVAWWRRRRRRRMCACICIGFLKGLEGIWRVFFFFFSFPSFFEIGFTRRRAVSLHLWMKSMWLASRTAGSFSTAPADICSWFVQQNPGAGRGAVVGKGGGGREEERRRRVGGVFFLGRYLRGFEGSGGRGWRIMENLICFFNSVVWRSKESTVDPSPS